MTNKEIWEIALNQSAVDYGCEPADFLAKRWKITRSRAHPKARKYLPLPFQLDMTSYGSCIVAQCSEELEDAVTMICTDVGHIGAENEDPMGIGDMLKDAMGGIKGALETKVINAADYVL